MRTVSIGVLLGASMLVMSGASQAADVVAAEPAGVDWSGFYMGLHGGWGWADADAEYGDDEANEKCGDSEEYEEHDRFFIGKSQPGCAVDLKPEGGFVGAQAGFNFVFDNGLLLGVEGDYALASLNDSGEGGTGFFNTHVDLEIEQLASIRARLGMAMGQWLPFATAGWGWAQADRSTFNSLFGSSSESNWHDGWTAGVGAEYAINDAWSVKAEYRYYDLGEENYGVAAPGGTNVDLELHTVQVGVNIHF